MNIDFPPHDPLAQFPFEGRDVVRMADGADHRAAFISVDGGAFAPDERARSAASDGVSGRLN
jgi:hypothetical protein